MTKAAELAKMKFGGRKNIVINGAMNVAQRLTSVAGLGDGDEGYVTVDRMRHTAAQLPTPLLHQVNYLN